MEEQELLSGDLIPGQLYKMSSCVPFLHRPMGGPRTLFDAASYKNSWYQRCICSTLSENQPFMVVQVTPVWRERVYGTVNYDEAQTHSVLVVSTSGMGWLAGVTVSMMRFVRLCHA